MRYRAVTALHILFSWTENQNIWYCRILFLLFLSYVFESDPLFFHLFFYFVIHVRVVLLNICICERQRMY